MRSLALKLQASLPLLTLWLMPLLCLASGYRPPGGAGGSGPQAANAVLVGPTSGVPALPTFRALVSADIPSIGFNTLTGNLDLTSQVSGVLPTANGGNGNVYGSGLMSSVRRFFAWQCPSNVASTMKGQGAADMGTNWSVINNLVYSGRQGLQAETAVSTSDHGFFNSDNLIQIQQKPVMSGWIVPNVASIGRINWGWTVNVSNCLDGTYTNTAAIVWDETVGGDYVFKHGTSSDDLHVAPVDGVINDVILDYSDGANLNVYIDGVLRDTVTSDLPTASTYLAVIAGIKNLTPANAARSLLGIGRISITLQ